jgi:hypothetical protein
MLSTVTGKEAICAKHRSKRSKMKTPCAPSTTSAAVRGKYAGRIQRDTIMVTLAPDVAAAFPDAESVNEALRVLIKVARKASKKAAAA